MSWFRKKVVADEPSIPFGALRIVKVWSGHYVIEEYGARLVPYYPSCRLLKAWWTKEEAGEFDTADAAIERLKFMGKFDMLMTGEPA